MSKIIDNKKLFLIIKMSRVEVINVFESFGICDCCNIPKEDGYYIAVLNSWYCEKCFNKWIEKAVNYPDDKKFELDMFDKVINKIKTQKNGKNS